ncbi:Coenzyme F420 hydrogenase/dehydrogenase, beta subunit C-terminal domain [uncultured Sphingomonas sp.]|uniref:Coenzyme F420 hydrogenase/dehydrogenase, beta subunit C-terminal domain n=1 Tax=uncultured Sphingomonas sp. TaxID=158754 RepID=UPI0025E7B827|nr:Coenzyme F420 hydrogenase/dehydrogenase, beta subunit C-terminal domain [uncultured Sphingomonas sp.]
MPPSPPEPAVSPRDMVASGLCIGCGSCVAAEPRAAMEWNRYGQLEPTGPRDWYRGRSTDLAQRCPFSPSAANEDVIAAERFPGSAADPRLGRVEACYVGHAAEPGYRENGSSGGLVNWVAAELLRTGKVDAVAHVVPADPHGEGRFFRFRLSRSVGELFEGGKSRYYPVELSAVLREIRSTPGRYAIVGIPCFIKAVHLARRAEPVLAERITHTLGLFCGHMKSARFVESFAWQLGAPMDRVRSVDYRIKDAGRPANWYRAHLTLDDASTRSEDWWHLADGDWGAGFFQSAACNWCDDVVAETADISFGDAWVEPYSSDGRGTNVVVTRSPALAAMLRDGIADGRLALEPVDADFVANTQAAGFRHRREGLAWRLSRRRGGPVRPVKRVAPSSAGIPLRRRLVYRMRAWIARWSHRLAWLAHAFDAPVLYTGWARRSLAIYQGLTWSNGKWGGLFDRLFGPPVKH